ncbi:MAG TPA: CinA family protein [bacterium]|nr:CinA family protein [bacterium]
MYDTCLCSACLTSTLAIIVALLALLSTVIHRRERETLTRRATIVARLLAERRLTLSVAESCTGGLLASTLVSLPGISKVFAGGVVAYANEEKIARLGVRPETLAAHGAVSVETVCEMLAGLTTPAAIAVSGVAGPEGGSPDKPRGTVIIGLRCGEKTRVEQRLFAGDREEIRKKSVRAALDIMAELLKS